MKIESVIAREIFDSNGNPTVECQMILENGASVTASVPSGTSCGKYEAMELRDGGKRLEGKGVTKAVEHIEKTIAPMCIGQEPDVIALDAHMLEIDSTERKTHLGANTMLAASIAMCKAQAVANDMLTYELIAHLCGYESVTLPFPMFNIINGGQHGRSSLVCQEIMIMPVGASSFRQSLEWAIEIYRALESILLENGRSTALGIEGGFSSDFAHEKDALDTLMQAIVKAGVTNEQDVVLAIDMSASTFYDIKTKKYRWYKDKITSDDLIEFYEQLTTLYPICSVEDGLSQDDRKGWQKLTEHLAGQVQLIGDDIFATHPMRIADGINDSIANAAIIKPNQVGTITEVLQAVQLCKKYNLAPVVSHRSGETDDLFIVDLALGTNSGQLKAGGCMRGERMNKYNYLLRIEDELVLSVMGDL